MAMITVALAIYFLHPADATSLPHDVGARALSFSLHLLVVTVVAVGLGFLAWWLRAWLATGFFCLVAILSSFLALWPNVAMWQLAQQENVSLSLGTYLAYATHRDIAGPQLERSVVYGAAADGTKLVLDAWLSNVVTGGPSSPAVVKVHGGGWTGGSRSQGADWNRWLNQLSYLVFDAARITILGLSAGGHLAMLAAYSMGAARLPPSCDVPTVAVKSVINLYGPADLKLLYSSSGSLTGVQQVLRQYIGGSPTRYPDRYRTVSPLSYIGGTTPPTLIFLGKSDHIVPTEQARSLDQALAHAGVTHATYLLPGNDHGFEANWGGFGAQFVREKIKAFLQ